MLETFTATYEKAQAVVRDETFSSEWNDFIKTKMKSLLADGGLDDAAAPSLKKLQRDIQFPNRVAALVGVARHGGGREAAIILEAAKEDSAKGLSDRAALLKFLRHLHFLHRRGAQTIWVCSPPKAYTEWVFDELDGLDKTAMAAKLANTEEIFSSKHMKNMSIGTQDALKWCNKTLYILANAASKKGDGRKLVSRWFADENSTEKDLDRTISTLQDGFKKIGDVCNSNQLVFSDDTIDRSTQPGLWSTTYALVHEESLDVIYVEKVLMGRSGTRLEWAITIIHELSHREVKAKDHFYSEKGLKPSAATFPASDALANADNWGFFAADCNGQLTDGKLKSVLKSPAA
jgi:hypothetical protein